MDAGLILLLLVLGAAAFVWFIRRASESRIEAPPEVDAAGEDPAATGDLAEARSLAADPFAGESAVRPDRVLITHPAVRRAASHALSRGSEAAQYVVQDGDRIYFTFERIPDEATRRRALEIVRRVESGDRGSVTDIMWLVRHVFKQ